jgi:antitoxin component of MazEF toxin-antitoxin module
MTQTVTIDDSKPATSTKLRKTGGSISMIIPAATAAAIGIGEGDSVELRQTLTGEAVIVPVKAKRVRPKYSRAQLLAEAKDHVPLPDLASWQHVAPVGKEI